MTYYDLAVYPSDKQRKSTGMPNGDYPIWNKSSLKSAISLRGQSGTYSKAEVAKHIVKRAKALGLLDYVRKHSSISV